MRGHERLATSELRFLSLVRCPKCKGQIVEDEDSRPGRRWWRCLQCARQFDQGEIELLETVALVLAVFPFRERRLG